MTDKSKSVFEALTAVMAEVEAIGKGDRNNEQGYNFRGIDAVVNAVGPVFRKHGVIALPVKCQANYRDVLTSREKRSRECTVMVTYRFYGPAGDYVECEVPGESMDFGDKGAPKAMSVAYRILLLQALCIPTHEPDPDAQTYERADEPGAGSPEAIELFAAVMAAKDEAGLRRAWESIRDHLADGRISEREAAQLNSHVKRRQSEVKEAGGDSTRDVDRGGAEPGPAGEGTRPDGEGAGAVGPGRDGEAGGVRFGVQPRVPSRAGVGGSAQTPRGGADGSATVGGGRG